MSKNFASYVAYFVLNFCLVLSVLDDCVCNCMFVMRYFRSVKDHSTAHKVVRAGLLCSLLSGQKCSQVGIW